jgi:hypothetical protein
MGRAWGVYGGALVGSLCLGLVATDARAGCDKDTDCKGDRVCEDGKCVVAGSTTGGTAAPPVSSQACEKDYQCPSGLVCDNGRCSGGLIPSSPPTASLAPIAPSAELSKAGECRTDLDCPSDASCAKGRNDSVGFCRKYRDANAMIAGAVLLPIGVIGIPFSVVAITDKHIWAGGVALTVLSATMMDIGMGCLIVGAPRVAVRSGNNAAADVTLEPLIGPAWSGLLGTF